MLQRDKTGTGIGTEGNGKGNFKKLFGNSFCVFWICRRICCTSLLFVAKKFGKCEKKGGKIRNHTSGGKRYAGGLNAVGEKPCQKKGDRKNTNGLLTHLNERVFMHAPHSGKISVAYRRERNGQKRKRENADRDKRSHIVKKMDGDRFGKKKEEKRSGTPEGQTVDQTAF